MINIPLGWSQYQNPSLLLVFAIPVGPKFLNPNYSNLSLTRYILDFMS